MARYIVRRVLYMIPVTILLSFICFLVVDLAPGDFVSYYEAGVRAQTDLTDAQKEQQLEFASTLRKQFGLDRPVLGRYAAWIWRIVTKGDFGYSFMVMRPVTVVLMETMPFTILLGLLGFILGIIVTWSLGIYTATHQRSIGDYSVNIVAFLGMATPSFFLALLLMVLVVYVLGGNAGGLFSARYVNAPWSWGKFLDFSAHLALPLFVGIITGSGGGIRVQRAQLLDELSQPYVQTARAKGLPERTVVFKHAFRNSLHPWIMGMGGLLSSLISGDTMLSIVLGLPTASYVFYTALTQQDSYVAGAFLLMTTVLLQIGNLLADIALVWLDPRVRYD